VLPYCSACRIAAQRELGSNVAVSGYGQRPIPLRPDLIYDRGMVRAGAALVKTT